MIEMVYFSRCMPHRNCHILSIAPYKILPPTSGGHLGIVLVHHYLGKLCQDHVIGTRDNADNHTYAFQLHKLFPADVKRYIPLFKFTEIAGLARKYDITHIYCDHPYMALTAMALSKKLGIPWFLRSHNIESERFRAFSKKWWRIMRAYEGFVMRKASGIFFITPEDIAWARKAFNLPAAKCHLVPYGTTLSQPPEGHEQARITVARQLNINVQRPWLYFLGAQDYYPNTQAVSFILDEIAPRLSNKGIDAQILIAGKGLPEHLQQQIETTPNIRYTGFLPDIDLFLKGCDIMLNSVVLGGGIKTKAIEALGYNKIVISTQSGAAGLDTGACGGNLHIAPDHDWDDFTDLLINSIGQRPHIPQAFYDTYYWGNIAHKIIAIMKQCSSKNGPATNPIR